MYEYYNYEHNYNIFCLIFNFILIYGFNYHLVFSNFTCHNFLLLLIICESHSYNSIPGSYSIVFGSTMRIRCFNNSCLMVFSNDRCCSDTIVKNSLK